MRHVIKSAIKSLAALALLVMVAWGTGFALFILTSLVRAPADSGLKSDAVVVLTGGDGRIEEGLELFASGSAPNLFISGVHKDVKESEIRSLWKDAPPLPACCIILGHEALSTTQNAFETRDWVRQKHFETIRLVTADYHMNRALLELSRALPGIRILPHPIRQPSWTPDHPRFRWLYFTEYDKTLFRIFSIVFLNDQTP